MAAPPSVVKEGWLLKRGEYLATWRPRYFVLEDNGNFRGYKTAPAPGENPMPINVFEVRGSSIKIEDDSKAKKTGKYGFTMSFLQYSRKIERSFHTESVDERDSWVEAYSNVKATLEAGKPAEKAGPADGAGAAGGATDGDDDRNRAMSFIDPKRPQRISMAMDDFDMLKVLGKGTFGKVMLCRHKSTSEIYAIKILKKSMVLEKDELDHTMTENSVLAKCSHPFLTCLRFSFQTPELLCFVLEYVNGGEIFFHLSKERRFTEDRTRFYISEICLAMTYLHDEGIIYRDLKLENLMLDNKGHIKITDFGLCKEEITFGSTTTTFCGTPEYLAPEVIEDSDYGRAVDWWGVGVVMYEMITGRLPFRSQSHEELFHKILTEPVPFTARDGSAIMPADAKDLASKLLIKEPLKRLGGDERDGHGVMEHKWFASIDFNKMYRKEIPVPFVPKIKSETDVGNFDTYFTQEEAKVTPDEESALFTTEDKDKFTAFESVAK